MAHISDIQIYSARWQALVMLFAVPNEKRGGTTKSEAIGTISERGWFDLKSDDLVPYPSNAETSREPRWKTMIAWARKDAVEHQLMELFRPDDWDLTSKGRDLFEDVNRGCKAHGIKVRMCFLWSIGFKKHMDPDYVQNTRPELKRPHDLYNDFAAANLIADLDLD